MLARRRLSFSGADRRVQCAGADPANADWIVPTAEASQRLVHVAFFKMNDAHEQVCPGTRFWDVRGCFRFRRFHFRAGSFGG